MNQLTVTGVETGNRRVAVFCRIMSRIIAGSHGGRRIATPTHSLTRPTTDRVREAAFSVIADFFDNGGTAAAESLVGFSFCDLYAGSGAVGLEAASRGAARVLLVERDKRTAALARANATDLGLGQVVSVVSAGVEKLVETPPAVPYDVVWLDPPYEVASDTVNLVVSRLCDSGWLGSNALVVVERSTRTDPVSWPAQLPDRWTRRYGETTLHFGAKEA